MIVKKFQATNYRGIKNLIVSFQQGINLIIGENGAGKTSLISGMGAWLSTAFAFSQGISSVKIKDMDVHMTPLQEGDATFHIQYDYPMELGGSLVLDGKDYSFSRIRKSLSDTGRLDNYDFANVFQNMLSRPESAFPLMCYFSAGRNYDNVQLTGVTFKQKPYDRIDGYINCFSESKHDAFIQAETWCMQMELLAFQRGDKVEEYEKFKDSIHRFFQKIDPEQNIKDVKFSTQFGTMVLSTEQGTIPIYSLSDGYKYLYGMILELVYRATLLNPQKDFRIEDTEGIVIVDEVDVHLHPRWQWRIIDALLEIFPKVQFIFATHSPMIISSAKDAHIIRLSDPDHAEYEEGKYGYSTEDILTLSQESSDVPELLSKIYLNLQNYFDKGDIQSAERYLHTDVEEKYGTESPEAQKAREYFDMNRWIGESYDDID